AHRQGRARVGRDMRIDLDIFVVESKRWYDVEFPEPAEALDKQRLIIRVAILIEGHQPRCRPARRIQKVRSKKARTHRIVIQRVPLERCFAMVNYPSESEGTATK